MKRFAIYTPYLDSFGGGERYALSVAEAWSKAGQVDILIDSHLASLKPREIIEKSQGYFNLDLSKVKIIDAPIGPGSSFLKRCLFMRKYDALFYLTDGSIFLATAKKNFLHIHSPYKCIYSNSEWGRKKIRSWNLIVYNSKFTRNIAETEWRRPGVIVYPPVDVDEIKPLKKEKIILNVGRLSGYLKDKKHDLLIEEFKKIHEKAKGWSLYLAGSAGEGDKPYLEELKDLAGKLPVHILPNLGFEELMELFGKASIYWHAKGYQVEDPLLMEHFGITTVEAMAGGAVPVVVNRGGQVEIVRDNECGFLWNGLEELQEMTLNLIKDENLREEYAKKCIEAAQQYNKKRFDEEILKLVEGK